MIATTQIGPAWIGRTIAALMLRLFTRRGCQNPAHNHSQDWAVAASQCPDYRQLNLLRH